MHTSIKITQVMFRMCSASCTIKKSDAEATCIHNKAILAVCYWGDLFYLDSKQVGLTGITACNLISGEKGSCGQLHLGRFWNTPGWKPEIRVKRAACVCLLKINELNFPLFDELIASCWPFPVNRFHYMCHFKGHNWKIFWCVGALRRSSEL